MLKINFSNSKMACRKPNLYFLRLQNKLRNNYYILDGEGELDITLTGKIHYLKMNQVLTDFIGINEVSDIITIKYVCDMIDFFSFPPAVQTYIENKHCVLKNYKWTLFGYLHGPGDTPAIISSNPTIWRKEGIFYRNGDNPTYISGNRMEYRQRGRLHRNLGPAVIRGNYFRQYFRHGKLVGTRTSYKNKYDYEEL